VLQESEFERVGGIKTLKVDVRLVTATNRDLQKEVASGNFREDLFYRLNVVPIHLPPLRERSGDIPLLVEHFVSKFNERLKKQVVRVEDDALAHLVAHSWPGNIRELENVLERSILFSDGPAIRARDLPPELAGAPAADAPLRPLEPGTSRPSGAPEGSLKEMVRQETERLERELIQRALDETGGNVTQAARKLKISRKSLQNKMKEFGLRDKE
jgi:DNA-binding NtrC family response regulator